MNDEKIEEADIKHVDVETYRIAAEHAHTGWDDYASAQLSFPYLMGLAARFRGIKVHHFNEETRRDPAFGEFAKSSPSRRRLRSMGFIRSCALRASP